MAKQQKEKWGSPEMQKQAKAENEKQAQLIIKIFKTKKAIADYALIQEYTLARLTWLFEMAYNMLTPEQKAKVDRAKSEAKFDKIAQST